MEFPADFLSLGRGSVKGSRKGPSSRLYGHPGATNESSFTAEVLHFPLPAKFKMP